MGCDLTPEPKVLSNRLNCSQLMLYSVSQNNFSQILHAAIYTRLKNFVQLPDELMPY